MSEVYVYYHLTNPAAVLRATGPDAFTFLQSQFANDLKNPGVDQPVTYGLWLDHKGKIQADSFVVEKAPDNFLLISYDCSAAALRAQLESRLIADEVTLTDETTNYKLLHVWPVELDADLAELIADVADPATSESWLGRRPVANVAWDILTTPAVMESIIAKLQTHGVAPASAAAMHAARILTGVAAVPQDAGPGDLPQEAALAGAGIALDKGCYLGQEVMQRLETQGHINRALWQVMWESQEALPANLEPVPLYLDHEAVGELRSRVSGEGKNIGLAMLKLRALGGRPSLAFSPNGPKVVELVRSLAVNG